MIRLLAAFVLLLPMAAWGETTTVVVSRADCANLVQHVPSADVAYKPGVDVRGKPVVPADVGGGVQLAMPEEITIDVEVDLAARFGLPPQTPPTKDLYRPTAKIGTVTYKNGKVFFNGQPLTNPETEALAEACRRQR